MDLDSAAEELYGVPAEQFAEHRTRLAAQAKAEGDKVLAASIGKLRKPVLAAALVNELVRGEPAELAELTDLGEQMRTAHRELRGPELRALSEQRQDLLHRLTELVRGTAERGGRTATELVLTQVRGTFEAAIADEAAEAAVLSGRLTTVLSYTGFGEVDVNDAVGAPVRRRHLRSVPAGADAHADDEAAVNAGDDVKPTGTKDTSTKPAGTRTAGTKARAGAAGETAAKPAAKTGPSSAEQAHQRRLQRHQEQLRRAEAEHAEAARTLEQAEAEASTAGQRHQEATALVEELRAQLEQAQEQAWAAGQARRAADRARLGAEEESDRTAAALRTARRQLASLESDGESD